MGDPAQPYWDRLVDSSQALLGRLGEETGLRDVIDELARFNDPGLSASRVIKDVLNVAWQAKDIPLQTVFTGAVEANRGFGAGVMTGAQDPAKALLRFTPLGVPMALNDMATPGTPISNFATGGASEAEREIAPGTFKALTGTDMVLFGVDRAKQQDLSLLVQGIPVVGAWMQGAYEGATANKAPGQFPNETYIPPNWDIYAPDAGQQMQDSDLATARLIYTVAGEALMDPANWYMKPLAAALAARTATRLVPMAGGEAFTSAADLVGETRRGLLTRRALMQPTGMGQWSQQKMLQAFNDLPAYQKMAQQLAENRDLNWAYNFFGGNKLAQGDAAAELARASVSLDTPEQIVHLFNAAAFRNRESIDIIREAVAANRPVANSLDSLFGTGDNVFDKIRVDFPDGSIIPDGHTLKIDAKQYLDDAFAENPQSKQIWDDLADEERAKVVTDFRDAAINRDKGIQAVKQMFGPDAVPNQILEKVPAAGILQKGTKVEKALRRADEGNWLAHSTTSVHVIPGPVSRFRPRFLLMSKPGLTFQLHGMNAVNKVDDMIKYANDLIGPTTPGYQFANDPEVLSMRAAFIDAGASTTAPEQIRAQIVNNLQAYVLTKLGQGAGFEYDVAQQIANAGMDKSATMLSAMMKGEEGYMTIVLEDGIPQILVGHPGTVRQTANFIPIMDWAGVQKAMRSPKMRALVDPDSTMSVGWEKVEDTFAQEKHLLGGRSGLQQFGRNPVVKAGHQIVDIADIANNFFKIGVLMRLGYGVRNVTEGYLSASASGIGWMNIMAAADFPTLVDNFAYNLKTMVPRMDDRFNTWIGWTKNEELLDIAARKAIEDVNLSNDAIKRIVNTLTEDTTFRTLQREVADSTLSDERRDAALQAMQYIIARKHQLMIAVENEMIEEGVAWADDAKAAQRLYHADPSGTMKNVAESKYGDDVWELREEISAPISMTPHADIAKAKIDSGWDYQYKSGARPAWQSRKPRKYSEVEARFWYKDKDGNVHDGMLTKPDVEDYDNVHMIGLDEAVARSKSAPPMIWVQEDGKWVRRRADYISIRDTQRGAYEEFDVTANIGKAKPFKSGSLKGHPDSAQAQWYEHQQKLIEQSKTHVVQYRESDSERWKTLRFVGGKPRKYVAGVSDNWEFRTLPKEVAANPTRQRVLGIDTWGKEVDFTNPDVMENVISQYTDLDPSVLEAAITQGDRVAQNKISEVLSNHGIYRTVWLDSDDWGGMHVLVHPKGIGGRGFRDAVRKEIDQVTARAAADAPMSVDEALDLSRSEVKLLNKGRGKYAIGDPVHPNYATDRIGVLRNGGFDEVMQEAIAEHVKAIRRRNAVMSAYQKRMETVKDLTKKRGIGERNIALTSNYKPGYLTTDMLHGINGAAYGQFVSADMTAATTIGGSIHRADLLNDMRTSFLQPKTIDANDPHYWDALQNLLGRYYRDTAGAQDVAKLAGTAPTFDIDPVVKMALMPGDRERLYKQTVQWALSTDEGQDWVRTMGLTMPVSGKVEDAVALAEKAAAQRGNPKFASKAEELAARKATGKAARTISEQNAAVPWGKGTPIGVPVSDVQVGDLIASQFNFVENFMLQNQKVRDLFLSGEATADNLRKAWEAAPWELKPFHGALSPTSAEYRAMVANSAGTREDMTKISRKILRSMGNVLRGLGSQPETRLLRHPMFIHVGATDLQQRITYAEKVLQRPVTATEFEKLKGLSQAYALEKVKETLYTLESRSTADDYLRFISPFFPAWVSSISRWGKFYARNPAGPGRIYARFSSVTNNPNNITEPGMVLVNENGEPMEADDINAYDSYLMLPVGVGMLPGINMVPGAREAMNRTRIPLRSLDVVFQGDALNPGFGPVVAVAAQKILNDRDKWFQDPNGLGRKVIEKILPVGPINTGNEVTDSILQFLPTSVRRAWDAASTNQAWLSTYNRMYLTLLETHDYTGAAGYEQLQKDASSLTSLMQAVKVASAIASPVAMQQQGEIEYYAAYFRELRDKYDGDANKAQEEFLLRFPEKWLLSQTSTINQTGGSSTAMTTDNQRKYTTIERIANTLGDPKLLAFTDNLQPDGTMVEPKTEDYNPYSRRWQTLNNPAGSNQPYRDARTPEEVVREGRISEGWTAYGMVEDMVTGQLVAQGYDVNSYSFLKAKNELMAIMGDKIGETNPEWNQARNDFNLKKKETAAAHFRAVINDPTWMADNGDLQVTKDIKDYLDTRDEIREMMERKQAENPDAASSTAALENAPLAAYLEWKRAQLSADSATFKWWVDRYFRNDVVSTEPVEIGGF